MPDRARGTLLAFDFGEKRIGVAVGELELRSAHPLATIGFEDNARRMQAIDALVREWRPVRLLVGCPARDDGAEHPVGMLARKFARRLGARFGLPVSLVDERLSSHAAQAELSAAGRRHARGAALLDQIAARIILETWFSSDATAEHAA